MNEKLSKWLYDFDAFQFWLLIGSAFLLGGVMSYCIFGLENQNIWQYLVAPTEDKASDFLSLSAKTLGVLIAIITPISLNLVSNILKAYQDKRVAEKFRNEIAYKSLFGVIMPTIVFIFLLIFFECNCRILTWLSLLLVFLSFFIFYKYIRILEKYSTNIDDVILSWARGEIDFFLDKKTKTKLWSRHKPPKKAEDLFYAFELFRKIIKQKITYGQQQEVDNILDELFRLSEEVMIKCENNPAFHNLLFRIDESRFREHKELDEWHEFFHSILGMFYDIWREAITNQMHNLAYNVVDKLIVFQSKLYTKTVNPGYIKYIHHLYKMMLLLRIKRTNELKLQKKRSLPLVYKWYFSNMYGDSSILNINIMSLYYYLFENIQILILENQEYLFSSFIKESSQHICELPASTSLSIPDKSAYRQLKSNYDLLISRNDCLYTLQEFQEWKNRLLTFKERLSEQNFISFQERELRIMENQASNFFKRNLLWINYINIAAYALFKERYSFVNAIFNSTSPNLTWGETDVLPRNLKASWELIISYQNSINYNFLESYIENPYRSQNSVNQILLLILFRVSKTDPYNGVFSNLDIKKVSSAKYTLEVLERNISLLKNEALLKVFNTDQSQIQNALREFIPKMLVQLKIKEQNYLQNAPINISHIDNYKNALEKNFNRHTRLINLLREFGEIKLNNFTSEEADTYWRELGIEKQHFINEWHTAGGASTSVANHLAEDTNYYIAQALKECCEDSPISLKEYLEQNDLSLQSKVLIMINSRLHRQFSFDELLNSNNTYNFNGKDEVFDFLYKDNLIVTEIDLYNGKSPKYALLIEINGNSLGTINQYLASEGNEDVNNTNEKDNLLSIAVDFYSDNSQLKQDAANKYKDVTSSTLDKMGLTKLGISLIYEAGDFKGTLFNKEQLQ